MFGAVRLFGGKLTDGGEQRRVDGAEVKQEIAQPLKNLEVVGGIDGRRGIWECSKLRFGTIVRALPRVRGMLRGAGRGMLESLKGALNVPRHADVACARRIIPL